MKQQVQQPAPVSRTLQGKAKTSNQASVSNVLQAYKKDISQRQEIEDDDELLQGKFETTQRDELEDDELLQGKFETAQRDELDDVELLQGKFETTQREELEDDEELLQGKFEPTQRQETPNNTGLPDNLKAGVEQLSGLDMSDVKVHYNSSKPASVQAYAYTQGTDIHVAPGQEKHLGHEAWHVAQQKQGRVQPTTTVAGMAVNDNAGLEKEADVMGGGAMQMKTKENNSVGQKKSDGKQGFGLVDNRPEIIAQRKLQKMANISPTLTGEVKPIQRSINLNGETNPDLLWPQVTNLVVSRYKRKQTIYRWAEDAITRNYSDAQTLANDLDTANAKGGALGRGRPAFSSKLTAIFNQTYGGSWHRRHIIMSSQMRNAVYATTEGNMASNSDNLLTLYNYLVSLAGGPAASTIAQAEANLVYVLHNNPANLVIDRGDWNSAIGAFAHNVKMKLEQDPSDAFAEYQQDRGVFFNSLVRGFQTNIQKQIAEFWQNFEEPNDVFEFTDLLETMYDNAAVDLLSNREMPQQQNLTALLLQAYQLFLNSEKNGNLNNLQEACSIYIATGTNIGAQIDGKPIYYSDVL